MAREQAGVQSVGLGASAYVRVERTERGASAPRLDVIVACASTYRQPLACTRTRQRGTRAQSYHSVLNRMKEQLVMHRVGISVLHLGSECPCRIFSQASQPANSLHLSSSGPELNPSEVPRMRLPPGGAGRHQEILLGKAPASYSPSSSQ